MRIMLLDSGFQVGIKIGKKAYCIKLPFPLRWSTIKYYFKR